MSLLHGPAPAPSSGEMDVTLICDLGFGDSGKGTTAEHLVRRDGARTVVRYNGGAQAAHNVVTEDGRHHTFAQFGSGTFAGAKTHLSRFMMVNPLALIKEGQALKEKGVTDPFRLLTLEGGALVTTPYHQAMNQLREIARGDARHGSCGMGIGETRADDIFHGVSLRVDDLTRRDVLLERFEAIRQHKLAQIAELALPDSDETRSALAFFEDPNLGPAFADVAGYLTGEAAVVGPDYLGYLLEEGPAVFEGAQGVLLDESHGFHPYTTWSDITFENAKTLLDELGYAGPVTRLGVLRGYFTRHGAGPFPTEIPSLSAELPELHNSYGRWQEDFRYGFFDSVLARYALEVVGGVDGLVLTSLDRMQARDEWAVATSYDHDEAGVYEEGRLIPGLKGDRATRQRISDFVAGAKPEYEAVAAKDYVSRLEELLEVPVVLESWGPTSADKHAPRPILDLVG